ncbi:MAG: hypothetical protein U0L54_06205, partial [Bacteroidales bacterium]|nr:hypothetical protein [Bacteroidales bacterium]
TILIHYIYKVKKNERKSCCFVDLLTCCPLTSAFAILRPLREKSQSSSLTAQSKKYGVYSEIFVSLHFISIHLWEIYWQ